MTKSLQYTTLSICSEMNREEFFTGLYERVFPCVAGFIRKQNGTLDDAKDIFHDALIILYEKKAGGNPEVLLNDEAYVFGIVKHLWIRKSKESKHFIMGDEESIISIPEDVELTPSTNAIVAFLKSSGEKCMTLLQAFYFDNKTLDHIQSSFGFSSIRSATVQKFKCLEKIRELVKNKSKQYEDFFE